MQFVCTFWNKGNPRRITFFGIGNREKLNELFVCLIHWDSGFVTELGRNPHPFGIFLMFPPLPINLPWPCLHVLLLPPPTASPSTVKAPPASIAPLTAAARLPPASAGLAPNEVSMQAASAILTSVAYYNDKGQVRSLNSDWEGPH